MLSRRPAPRSDPHSGVNPQARGHDMADRDLKSVKLPPHEDPKDDFIYAPVNQLR
jgi:hypothetical protein